MNIKTIVMGTSFALATASGLAQAEDTDITVRVMSKDAKFVGTSMGGVRVILRDKETDEVLAQGVTAGGTGNTAKIMHENGGRRAAMADKSAASFDTTLDLDRPRMIEAEVYGPLAQLQAAHGASATQWVIPGGHLSVGDGWVIELPGLVVNILEPAAAQNVSASESDSLSVSANVMMMCGCPITKGGLWDAEKFEVGMTITMDGKNISEEVMSYAGKSSLFSGEIPISESGIYDVIVHAYDPKNGNTGIDKTTVVVN
ncbi:MAG: hypothetical protein U5L98_07180 [Halomonas sp.]|uniref:hypothetical protein n=1 Tax=Halomonas sp. TaxID=1486246 RepID=UPI002ACD74A0|nr:hypothetical protein [Halomonas sp.]MDZ7852424.1 hypothetical protein [Halomonas sp.]